MKAIILLLCCTCCFSVVSYAQAISKKLPEQEKLNIKGGGAAPRIIYTPVAPAPPQGLASDAPAVKAPANKTVPPAVPSPLINQGTPKENPLNITELTRKAAEALKASKQQ